jgi:patatin-like phospholipase/acyl hydrolase
VAFQILSLSGGGFLGLYTAAILAKIEEASGKPIADSFDLIAGTSIGGIIALGLASRKPAADILDAFKENGDKIFSQRPAPQNWFNKKFDLTRSAKSAKYSSAKLSEVIADIVGSEARIADLKQRVIIPAVNLTKGRPQVFKTPHHETFIRDLKLPVVDVAMATSAAPTFFPLHKIGGELFADGGLYANAPDQLALHEAEYFLKQKKEEIFLLSIGTTTAHFSFSNSVGRNMGWLGWMDDQRLPSVMIAAQQINSHSVMKHQLGEHYSRIDQVQSREQERYLALDVATPEAISDLEGLAEASVREHLGSDYLRARLEHEAPMQDFSQSVRVM